MENTSQQTITVVDLDLLRNIVDLACQRGAFRGAEISQVGAVYDKLTKFLEAIVEQAQEEGNLNEPITETIDGGELPLVDETPEGE